MRIRIFLKNKKIYLDVKKCSGLCKIFGLMFKRDSKPLLFEFNKDVRVPLHSLFCKPFIVLWLDENNEVTDFKIVKKLKFNVVCRTKFRKVIEIPLSHNKASFFLREEKSLNTSKANK